MRSCNLAHRRDRGVQAERVAEPAEAGFLGGTRALARGEPKPEAAPLQCAEGLAPKKRPRLRHKMREVASPSGEDVFQLRALVAASNRPEGTRPASVKTRTAPALVIKDHSHKSA